MRDSLSPRRQKRRRHPLADPHLRGPIRARALRRSQKIYVILRSGGRGVCPQQPRRPRRLLHLRQHQANARARGEPIQRQPDYFYVKKADASRVYGLELEELLSPNAINFLVHEDTLIEEHHRRAGDDFMKNYMDDVDLHEVRLAKEFVKFNEKRCFVQLRATAAPTTMSSRSLQTSKKTNIVHTIDFDQQSYEGRRNLYRPQFFKNNLPVIRSARADQPRDQPAIPARGAQPDQTPPQLRTRPRQAPTSACVLIASPALKRPTATRRAPATRWPIFFVSASR